jgi:hypothetical protein
MTTKRTNRVWIEIVVLATAIACGIALLFATLGAAAGAAGSEASVGEAPAGAAQVAEEKARQDLQPSPVEQTYMGMVTCSRCGAKHSADLAQSATKCVRICVHGGAGFALVDDEVTYLLDGDLVSLQRLAGQRARVVGALNGNTIRISSVSAQT